MQSHVLLLWKEDEKFEVLDVLKLKTIREWGLLSPMGADAASPPTWLRNTVCEYMSVLFFFVKYSSNLTY